MKQKYIVRFSGSIIVEAPDQETAINALEGLSDIDLLNAIKDTTAKVTTKDENARCWYVADNESPVQKWGLLE